MMCRDLPGRLSLLFAVLLAIAAIRVSAEDVPKPSTDNVGNVEVVAEGTGKTPDEALTDAFRNAVRQVVGAVVDAETLVKNDEVIDDQILTYSNGFVKKYVEVPGSKKQKDGLHRIKIKAEVERRNLVAKLKSAKVMMKGFDGKSLFAEVVTTGEAAQNSTKLLAKALSDLPKLLTATVEGKPHYDRDTSELIVDIVLEVDMKAYQDFSTRLQDTLDKISLAKETFQMNRQQTVHIDGRTSWISAASNNNPLLGPKISADKGKVWCFWVCDPSAKDHSQLRWNGYILDATISTTILPYVTRRRGFPTPRTLVRTSLLDSDEGIVTEDEFGLGGNSQLPWLAAIVPRHREIEAPATINGRGAEGDEWGVAYYEKASKQEVNTLSVNAYLAPYAIDVGQSRFSFQLKQSYQRRIKLPLDKLKLIEDVNCSVIYTPDAAATK